MTTQQARANADEKTMVRRHAACISVALVVLVGCGSNEFTRADAIEALTVTGLSDAESNCVADSLLDLEHLAAADPRDRRSDDERVALVAATGRCVAPQPIATTSASSADATIQDADPEGTPMGELGAPIVASDPEAERRSAISALQLAGRSAELAHCIVDQLVEMGAEAVFTEPKFGLGLDPLEADAFAACAS